MTQEEFDGHLKDTYRCLWDVLNTTNDPAERTAALFVAYSRQAGMYAELFWDSLQRDAGSKPHLDQDDLSAHAHVVVGEQIRVFLDQNHRLGIVGPDLDHITAETVGQSFFARLNKLLEAVPPAGHA